MHRVSAILRIVSPNVNPLPFSKVCDRISAELIALENEQRLARLADPRYRASLANLYRMVLTEEPEDATRAEQGAPTGGRRGERLYKFAVKNDRIWRRDLRFRGGTSDCGVLLMDQLEWETSVRSIAAANNIPYDLAEDYFLQIGDTPVVDEADGPDSDLVCVRDEAGREIKIKVPRE